jgi:uncharacterized membrane protein
MRGFRLAHWLKTSLWLTPTLVAAAGFVLALVTIAIDRHYDYSLVSQAVTGSPDNAAFILSAFITSIATLMGLVLTMTLVVVQLAMGQFSPRIVRSLLEGHPSQLVIGIFTATIVQAGMGMRALKDSAVPGVTVLTAYALMLASLVTLFVYVHKVGKALHVATLIDLVGDQARALVDVQTAPPPAADADADEREIGSAWVGNVFRVDREGLVAAAAAAGCVIELVPAVGDFVPTGAPLMRIHGGRVPPADDLRKLVALGQERTMDEDLAYGFRMLVDIGERSLSGPFDDPTTAVQALHRLHDLLRQLARRELPSGRHYDAEGELRLLEPTLDWDGYVRLAFDELRVAGSGSPQIPRRIREAIDDLKSIAPPERQEALDRQLALLDGDPVPDRQGIGSGRDVIARAPVPTP